MKYVLALLLITFLFTEAIAQEVSKNILAKIIKVQDGDTADALYRDSLVRLRLYGIDAPEAGQDFFQESKQLLQALILGEELTLELKGKDRFGRMLAIIIRTRDSLNINSEMVKQGLAWHFTRYSYDPLLASLEENARKKEIGIWSLYHYLEPWEFRKNMQ